MHAENSNAVAKLRLLSALFATMIFSANLLAEPTPKISAIETNLPTIEVAQGVTVTADLDFGLHVPRLAEALNQVDRLYQPDDKTGRTFAVLDAHSITTTNGKMRISMQLSTEKAGLGILVFRRTAETLWKSRIVPATRPSESYFVGKKLIIMLDDGKGKTHRLDDSLDAASIMDLLVRDLGTPVRDFWPDGEERELTFLYSTCDCPVKARMRRVGDKTVRSKDFSILFPDDPIAAKTITHLMGWK
jgi:hypothetical protein